MSTFIQCPYKAYMRICMKPCNNTTNNIHACVSY